MKNLTMLSDLIQKLQAEPNLKEIDFNQFRQEYDLTRNAFEFLNHSFLDNEYFQGKLYGNPECPTCLIINDQVHPLKAEEEVYFSTLVKLKDLLELKITKAADENSFKHLDCYSIHYQGNLIFNCGILKV
ncbi:MAG: hypothetical protein RLZZ499_3412 [Cyanobacteriota bacterium]|jgi:hypothetical protein